jgi:hypothetical protein
VTTPDYYVTPAEFFDAIEKAFFKVYCEESEKDFYEIKCHPEDIAVNATVIIESVGAYLSARMYEERRMTRESSSLAANGCSHER